MAALEQLYAPDVDCWDFGADTNSMFVAREFLGARKPVGLTIDLDRIEHMTKAGDLAVECDILRIPRPGNVRVVSMLHFLEHLPTPADCRTAIKLGLDSASDLVALGGPIFEEDDFLREQGFKFNWGDWEEHDNRYSLPLFLELLDDLGARARSVSIGFPYVDTLGENILTLDDARNQGEPWDPRQNRPKTLRTLPRPAYQEFLVLIPKHPGIDTAAIHTARHGRFGVLMYELLAQLDYDERLFANVLHSMANF